MGWVKLDDNFTRHPKVVALSLEAKWAYIEALCYSACYRTDGIVPNAVAANGSVRAELMASGLWESGTASEAVRIHDYLEYNPPRAYFEERAEAGAIGAAIRWGDSTSDNRPVPVPRPKIEDTRSFDEFWAVYPRKVGKPKARAAFKAALKRAPAEDIILGAKHYAEDPNRTDEFTAHPTTWLHRDGWDDPPEPSRAPRPGGRPPDPPRALIGAEGMEQVRKALGRED